MFIEVNEREHAAILAGLRCFQMQQHRSIEFHDIASNGGAHSVLTHAELDELCERVNVSPARITIGINVEGGNVQNVFTDALGVEIDCIKVDWDTEGADDDELVPVRSPYSAQSEVAFVGNIPVDRDPTWIRCYKEARNEDNRRDEARAVEDGAYAWIEREACT